MAGGLEPVHHSNDSGGIDLIWYEHSGGSGTAEDMHAAEHSTVALPAWI